MNIYEEIANELDWDDQNPLKSLFTGAASNQLALVGEKYIFGITQVSGIDYDIKTIKIFRREISNNNIEIFSRQAGFNPFNRSVEYKLMRYTYDKLRLFQTACENQKKRILTESITVMHNAAFVITEVRAKELSIDISDFKFVQMGSYVVYLIDEETAALILLQAL